MTWECRIEIIELSQLPSEGRMELEGDELDPYGTAELELQWREKDLYVACQCNSQLIALAGLVEAEVEVTANGRFDVVGLGDVIVGRRHRGCGYARVVIERALERADEMGPRLAMLFCGKCLVPLYERFGFSEIADPVTVCQPDGVIRMPLPSMWRSLAPGAKWPEGLVTLKGLPF